MNEIEPQEEVEPAEGAAESAAEGANVSEPPPAFLVVALGASAGGLNALQQFFEHLPPDSGMAFVVMMHLAPDHESHLAALLQGFTRMPVQQVNDTMVLEPNQVYVAPPNRNLFALGDHLGLAALEEQRSDRAPIDYFFRTLASTLGTRAVCVVLSGSGDEVQKLSADFLISVTNFFRDAEAFTALEREVIPGVFRNKQGEDQVRVWVSGCATGEEAYSMGMLLLEYAQHLQYPPHIQVFATDISEVALRRAREGLYPETIELDVTSTRLARFYYRDQGGYRVRHELRELVLFAPQNLLKDPPFSKIDLISCRNVLIYMQRNAQKQLLELFHYALRPDGYLFLGSAETIEDVRLFRDLSRRHGLFQRQPVASNEVRLPSLTLSQSPPLSRNASAVSKNCTSRSWNGTGLPA